MSVDPLFAQWLQADADYALRTDAGVVGRWGATAITTERRTGLATLAGAEAQANRELAFFARGPFAVDVHQLAGVDWISAIGFVVTIDGPELAYAGGVEVFVTGADPDRATGLSQVTVLRPLRTV